MCEQHIDRKCTKCGWGLPLLERNRLRASKKQIELRARGQETPNESHFHDAMYQTENLNLHGKRTSDSLGIDYTGERDLEGGTVKRICCRPSQASDSSPQIAYPPNMRTRFWKDIYSERYKVEAN